MTINTASLADAIAGKNLQHQDFVISRVLHAPRELVWKAWTEADRLMKWWGPKGFAMQVATVDLRPGGVFHYGMKSGTGQEMWGRFVYREIVAPERLVYILSFSDEAGGKTRHPMSLDWPEEMLNILTLTEQDGKTTLTLQGRPFNASASESQVYFEGHESMEMGYGATFRQLEEYLAQVTRD